MGRDDTNVHAGIISEKAAIGILSDSAKLRSRLRLCRASANAEDYLTMETYEWTPELLAYLDQWRQYRDKQRIENLGYDRRERKHEFLPRFLGKDLPKHLSRRLPRKDVLTEIGYHLACVHDVWRKSKLGTSRFKSMKIEDIGVLEKKIKSSFGMVVDLVYKMMLARWMDRRKRPAKWWASLQLRETNYFDREHESPVDFPESFSGDYAESLQENYTRHSLPDIAEFNEKSLHDATDRESVEHKKSQRSRMQFSAVGGFRRPSTVTLVNHASTSKKEATKLIPSPDLVMAKPLVFATPIRSHDVYAWTDKDVRAFTRNTKRIADVRAAMVGLRDRFDWLTTSREVTSVTDTETKSALGESACDAWRAACIATHLCTLTKKAASFAEEAAISEAASALTLKRSLYAAEGKTAAIEEDNEDLSALGVNSDEAHVQELQENVRHAHDRVAELLSLYDGQQSTEWRDVIISTSLATAQLLRTISENEFAHDLLAYSNSGGE
ncbi:unnamed protein product [Peronospora effusa]|uniref:Uncharacterized protein n=1 Tax=Peronospora effusa TaxID=542832 RepID=A0A3M6VEG9_9STRA|nr:hypothetical protein DD238_003843 [Peronospora effusa]RQM14299.1 hypothetical protein DD237_003690 [Peronospora effusa]CAI5700386.1 unnamed protein product [Peronospora effusa]